MTDQKRTNPSFFVLSLKYALAAMLVVGISKAAFAADNDEEGGGDLLEKTMGVPVHGFANMGYTQDNAYDLHRRYGSGFYLNNFDLYYSPDLGNRVRFLAEVVFEPDAVIQAPTFDAERLQAGYVFNNNLTVWAGRFHTPIGYYVIAYHHGMLLQTAIEKPRFLDFEDHYGVLPVHTNGIWVNGSVTAGENRIALMAWVGNSDRIITDSGGSNYAMLDFDMVNNSNNHVALGARVNVTSGGALDGLSYGASFLHETVDYQGNGGTTYGATGGVLDTTANPNTQLPGGYSTEFYLWALHAVYEAKGLEWLNEFYYFHDTNLVNYGGNVSPTNDSTAGYSQLAYWIRPDFAPYYRYERANFNTNDLYFISQYSGLPYEKSAVGVHYNVNDDAALKAELAQTTFQSASRTYTGTNFYTLLLDYSIRF